jgi:LSD1 subclass zinc finger protein
LPAVLTRHALRLSHLPQFTGAFAIARVPAYSDDGALAVVFTALLLFGAAAMPLAYLLHFPFANEMNALAAQMGIYFFFGVAQLIAAAVLRGLAALGKARGAWEVLRQLFRWLPHYNVGAILFNLTQNAAMPAAARASPWDTHVSGRELSCLAVEAGVYMALTLAVEFDIGGVALRSAQKLGERALKRLRPFSQEGVTPAGGCAEEEDVDVAAERNRIIAHAGDAGDILTLRALRKTYRGGKAAVKPLTLGVAEGRCFGLLGVNGAGKSTTFKMLTGEVPPSAGDALVRGRAGGVVGSEPYNVVSQLPAVRQRLGLCPQDDGIAARLTGREHLSFYAAIRGVPADAAAPLADALLSRLGLARWADRLAGTYSGGNKRKLSVAISLVGEPPLVLLDEPSSGMVRMRGCLAPGTCPCADAPRGTCIVPACSPQDPESRRAMWDVLARSMAHRAMVLTTHSMDEAEALCHDVGIMVGGRLRCHGSVAHLKHVHGGGYSLELRAPPDAAGRVAAFLAEALPAAALAEEHSGRLTYHIPRAGVALADVFEKLEGAREALGIWDYSLTQASLEQIFVAFAAQQEEERASPQGMAAARISVAAALPSAPLPPRAPPPPPVRCPGCEALLRWEAGASVMRCGACNALVGLPSPAAAGC